jgi:hypothetical protein
MSYIRPKNPVTIQLNDDYRIVAGEYAWIFAKKYDCDEEENRFRFYMNSPTLWGLLHLVKEYFIRRSSQKGIPEILEEVDLFITACMQSHDTFLTKYLPHERKMNGN